VKFFKKVSVLVVALVLVVGSSVFCFAAETLSEFRWAVNGMSAEGGFIGYYMAPGTEEWGEIWRVTDPALRIWTGPLVVAEGVNKYAISSFSDGIESEKSAAYTFEWIKPVTPGAPVPTVIITFGAVQ
jgi:hypothetical protein